MRRRSPALWAFLLFQLWLAHAFGYLVHEYAHSFVAVLLHAKANPFALDYGHVRVENVLLLSDIDENVDYAPLFAAGRGHAAALIAVSGVLLGNGLSYVLSLWLLHWARLRQRPLWGFFAYWLGVMSVGNFLSYVPVRTFASHADMYTVVQGLQVSPWVIALGLGIPFTMAMLHYLFRVMPQTAVFLFRTEPILQGFLVLMTTYSIFVFFGGIGLSNYGVAGHWCSALCVFALFPVLSIYCGQQTGRASTLGISCISTTEE